VYGKVLGLKKQSYSKQGKQVCEHFLWCLAGDLLLLPKCRVDFLCKVSVKNGGIYKMSLGGGFLSVFVSEYPDTCLSSE
jgi:hypothetical protein